MASLMWSGTGIWVHYLNEISLFNILLLRFVLSLFFVFVILLLRKEPIIKSKLDIIGGLPLTFYYILATTAFSFSNIVNVALIVSTTPIFVIFINLLKGRKESLLSIFGAVLAFSGTIFVIIGNNNSQISPTEQQNEIFGLFCALGAALAMSLFSVLGESNKTNTLRVNFWSYLFGSFIFIIFSNLNFVYTPSLSLNFYQITLMVGLVMFSTVIAGLTYNSACKLSGSSVASVVRLSTPLLSSFFAYIFLNQGLTIVHIIGGPIILLGIYFVIKSD